MDQAQRPSNSGITKNSPSLELYSSIPQQSLEKCSMQELGCLFSNLFLHGITIYRLILPDVDFISPLITNHQYLWSFKHLNVPAQKAQGLSVAVDLLHREFKALSFRLTEPLVPEIARCLDANERAVDVRVESDGQGKMRIVGSCVPGSASIALLEADRELSVNLIDLAQKEWPVRLLNNCRIGCKGESLLHTALCLRDQSISGVDQPEGVTHWIRDVIGLQDGVFLTSLRLRDQWVNAINEQAPGLNLEDVELDISIKQRTMIAESIRLEEHKIRWAEQIVTVYHPSWHQRHRIPLHKTLEIVGVEPGDYQIKSQIEAASLIYALAVSLPFNFEAYRKPDSRPPEQTLKQMKELSFEVSMAESDLRASGLILASGHLFDDLLGWGAIHQVALDGAINVRNLLHRYVDSAR